VIGGRSLFTPVGCRIHIGPSVIDAVLAARGSPRLRPLGRQPSLHQGKSAVIAPSGLHERQRGGRRTRQNETGRYPACFLNCLSPGSRVGLRGASSKSYCRRDDIPCRWLARANLKRSKSRGDRYVVKCATPIRSGGARHVRLRSVQLLRLYSLVLSAGLISR